MRRDNYPPIGYRFIWVNKYSWHGALGHTFEVVGYKPEAECALCCGPGAETPVPVHITHFKINGGTGEEPEQDPTYYINHDFEAAAKKNRDEVFRHMFRDDKRRLF